MDAKFRQFLAVYDRRPDLQSKWWCVGVYALLVTILGLIAPQFGNWAAKITARDTIAPWIVIGGIYGYLKWRAAEIRLEQWSDNPIGNQPQATSPNSAPVAALGFWSTMGPLLAFLAVVIVAALTLFVAAIHQPVAAAGNDQEGGAATNSRPADTRSDPAHSAASPTGNPGEPISTTSVKLDFNGIAYQPAENFQCDGEYWARWPQNDGTDDLAWEPGGDHPDKNPIIFHYRYDGRTLHLFGGHEQVGDTVTRPVTDRTLSLQHLPNGDWLLNGKRMKECAG